MPVASRARSERGEFGRMSRRGEGEFGRMSRRGEGEFSTRTSQLSDFGPSRMSFVAETRYKSKKTAYEDVALCCGSGKKKDDDRSASTDEDEDDGAHVSYRAGGLSDIQKELNKKKRQATSERAHKRKESIQKETQKAKEARREKRRVLDPEATDTDDDGPQPIPLSSERKEQDKKDEKKAEGKENKDKENKDRNDNSTIVEKLDACAGNQAIRRLSRRGGIMRITNEFCDTSRGVLRFFLQNVLRDAIVYMKHGERTTLKPLDVVYAVKRQGSTLYGFGI